MRTASRKEPQSIHDQWVFVGLLIVLFCAPLPLGSNRTWAIGLLVVSTVALLVASITKWRLHPVEALSRLRQFQLPLLLLLGIVSLSWLQTIPLPAQWVEFLSPHAASSQRPLEWMTLSLDLHQSRTMAALSFAYFSLFAVCIFAVRNADRLSTLALVLVCSGVFQSVLGAILFSIKAEYRIFYVAVSHSRMIGTYVYHNSLAGYLCMCLSVGIGLMLSRLDGKTTHHRHWRARVTAAIEFTLSPTMRLRLLLVVMVIALVLTKSRMGNAAFFAAMLIVGGAAIVLAKKTAPQTIALIVSLIVIDVLVVGTGVGLEKVVQRIQDTEMMVADGGQAESVEARTEAARTALPLAQDFALTGAGGGSFYNVFMGYRTSQYGYAYVDHTHNDFVEIASDYGLPGLAMFGALVVSTLWISLKGMAQRRSRLPWGTFFGVTMAIVALLIHSTVDFNLQIPANALTIVAILAMAWIAKHLPSGATRSNNRTEAQQ